MEVLRGSKQSGLVVDIKGSPRVLHARELLQVLRKKGNVTVAEVRPVARAVMFRDLDAENVVDLGAATGFPFEVPDHGRRAPPVAARRKSAAGSDERVIEFAVKRIRDGKAEVVTASERFEHILRVTPTFCVCQDDPSHVWDPRELSDPDKCDEDGEPVKCR